MVDKNSSKLKISVSATTDPTNLIAGTQKLVSDALTADPDTKAIWVSFDTAGQAAGQTVSSKYPGKTFPNKPLVVTFHADPSTQGLMKSGGIDAVVDKDLAAAVLARDLGATMLLILTDIDAVYADWGTPQQRPLPRLTADEADAMDKAGAFGEGSMAPKIRAAIDFVRRTGGRAIITALDRGRDAVHGKAGTTITESP